MTNKMKCYTVFYFCKLLYKFWVDSPPIIRSLTLYLQHLVFIKPLLLPAASFNPSTKVASSSNGLTSTRCCRYSFVLLMMGGGIHLKHVQQFTEIKKLCNVASC